MKKKGSNNKNKTNNHNNNLNHIVFSILLIKFRNKGQHNVLLFLQNMMIHF